MSGGRTTSTQGMSRMYLQHNHAHALATPELFGMPDEKKHMNDLGHTMNFLDGSTVEVTTLIIRNVPRRYTSTAILIELETFVKSGDYNMVYLPLDNSRASNCGYAFVNFVSAEIAARASQKMNGGHWHCVCSNKVIRIVPAHVQGLPAYLANFAGTCAAEDCNLHAPMVFVNGSRITFQYAVNIIGPLELQLKGSTSAYIKTDQELTCSNLEAMEMMTNASCGTQSTGSDKSYLASNLGATSMISDHSNDNSSCDHPPQDEVNEVAFKKGSKMRQLCQPSVTTDDPFATQCAPTMESDVRYSAGYREAWTALNVQLVTLLKSGIFQ